MNDSNRNIIGLSIILKKYCVLMFMHYLAKLSRENLDFVAGMLSCVSWLLVILEGFLLRIPTDIFQCHL